MFTIQHSKTSQFIQQHFMVDGIECFTQVYKNRTSQPTLVDVPTDSIRKTHTSPFRGVALKEAALIWAKHFVALKISIH